MPRQLRVEVTADAAVERVLATVTAPDYAERRAALLHDGGRLESREERPDGGVTTTISRLLPEGGPAFVQRFLPRDRRIRQTDDWEPPAPDGTRRGTWHVEAPGVPARIGGTVRLEPDGAGTRQVVDGTVAVSVPLVGGKAESFVAEMVEKLVRREAEVLRELL